MFKGHGTGNDFVIVPDVDGSLALRPQQVRALCDRHRGIGGDGVLRVVRVALDAEAQDLLARHDAAAAAAAPDPDGPRPEWFMDYRNADGSLAEMCGNGVRVFAQYLAGNGLAGGGFPLLTRGGVVTVRRADPSAAGEPRWTVGMGAAHRLEAAPIVQIGHEQWSSAAALEIPNPHVVVQLPDAAAVAALDLSRPPEVSPALPHGQNVEFVALTGPGRLTMRVHERGVGETQSCGTGICAAAVAMADLAGDPAARGSGPSSAAPQRWRVDVPGGSCDVDLLPDGQVELTGPAVIVAELSIDEGWLSAA
jgi:diaminopimelate epimerase